MAVEPPAEPPLDRRPLSLRAEFVLVLFPTLTVLVVLAFVERLTRQRILFASLAASAFLIYLDPTHRTNRIRTLIVAQLGSALFGWVAFLVFGPGYLSGGTAMLATVTLMILTDTMHPPAVATSLIFSFRAGPDRNLVIFGLAVLVTALLVGLQRTLAWHLARATRGR